MSDSRSSAALTTLEDEGRCSVELNPRKAETTSFLSAEIQPTSTAKYPANDYRKEKSYLGTAAAYPVDTTAALRLLLNAYKQDNTPIEVSFRTLVPWIKPDRATHYIHSYPAKLLPQIAHFFLATNELTTSGDKVLDPFCGTGTVALETILSGRTAYYADANPLARLISATKTTIIPSKKLHGILERLKERYLKTINAPQLDVVNIEHWYSNSTIKALSRLKATIDCERNQNVKNVLLITFSSVSRKVSRADSRFSVPVLSKMAREQNNKNVQSDIDVQAYVWTQFELQLIANVQRVRNYEALLETPKHAYCVGQDARLLVSPKGQVGTNQKPLPDKFIDLVITSPPYAGAQKYIRASSLSLGWLGIVGSNQLRDLEKKTIGREHFSATENKQIHLCGIPDADRIISNVYNVNKSRSCIASTYINEMRLVTLELARVMKPGGHVVLIIGDNEVCGHTFYTSTYVTTLFEEAGFDIRLKLIDKILSRGLIMKRNHTAGLITREWIIVLQRNHKS